jgi:hypothetical protein
MAMSRKDYVAAAEIIRRQVDAAAYLPTSGDGALFAAKAIAEDLASMFGRDNGRFDRTRFLNACGVGDPNGN